MSLCDHLAINHEYYREEMINRSCQKEEQYKAPMPWIGMYVAAASLVCSLAMAADVFLGFHHRKLWFPCKFFTLNAASLTLLAVATKLAVDLSPSMPTAIDELAKLTSTILMSTAIGSESQLGSQLDLNRFVLYLDGEEELPLQIMKNNRDDAYHLIQIGKKQQPKCLQELLGKSSSFKGVAKFDNNQISSLNSKEPPNCWTLPLVTLTSIAMALPNIENHTKERLHRSMREGLLYVSLVEKNLDSKADLVKIRNAAETVWLEVDLFSKWLDEDLRKIALEGKATKETLERLLGIAKSIVMEFKVNMNGNLKESPLNWPIKVIVANSMYRISQSLLLEHEKGNNQTDERMFEQLSAMAADILGACLTNLSRVIIMKCFCSAIEKREESVRHAAQLLGETEEIMKILQQRELPSLNPNKVAYIDEWRTLIKQENSLALTCSFCDSTGSGGPQIAGQ